MGTSSSGRRARGKGGSEPSGTESKPPRAKPRVNSRRKGVSFEEKIAREFRQIYDPPELLASLAEAAKAKGAGSVAAYRAILKTSRVRRSDQGRGAMEPDLVIQGCPLWLELQHARAVTPRGKLEQAERDAATAESSLRPVAVIHETGRWLTQAWMRFSTLLYLAGFDDLTDSEGEAIPLTEAPGAALAVMLDYEDLLARLRFREEVRCAAPEAD